MFIGWCVCLFWIWWSIVFFRVEVCVLVGLFGFLLCGVGCGVWILRCFVVMIFV